MRQAVAKDRSKKPLASWGAAAGLQAEPPPAPAPVKQKLSEKLGFNSKPVVTSQVIPMNSRMTGAMATAHRQMDHLAPWAQRFVASLDTYVVKTGGLTQRQWSKLQEILEGK